MEKAAGGVRKVGRGAMKRRDRALNRQQQRQHTRHFPTFSFFPPAKRGKNNLFQMRCEFAEGGVGKSRLSRDIFIREWRTYSYAFTRVAKTPDLLVSRWARVVVAVPRYMPF